MTVLAEEPQTQTHIQTMPEFEEDNANASQSESYTPSTDASKKPRTRRRSGGFKTEVASVSSAKMGEVSATEALKEEKLSGSQTPAEPSREREDKPRREREPRAERASREPRAPRPGRDYDDDESEPRAERKAREPREPRRETNPQPSAETLAAIANVEAQIAERRTERDARRAERDKDRPAKTERKPQPKREGGKKPSAKQKQSKGGLLAAITGFFGKLFGNKPKPAPKKGGNRGGQGRGGRPQGKGGNRGGQNRGRDGNRGGQGRKRGSQGGNRRNDRRHNDNAES